MVKLTVLYNHPEDPSAFEEYYANTHMPLAGKVPGVTKVELTKFVGTPEGNAPTHYRMAEIYFNSLEELQTNMASPEAQATVADIANFASGGVNVMIGDVQG